jgi:hypothetical protein
MKPLKLLTRLAVIAFILLLVFAFFGQNLNTLFKGLLGGIDKSLSTTISLPSSNIQAHLVHAASQSDTSDNASSHLQVAIGGLKPDTTYYLTIDEDSCHGPTLFDVGSLTTDDSGTVLKDFSLSLSDPQGLAGRKLWLDVHVDGYGGRTVSCPQIDTSLLR